MANNMLAAPPSLQQLRAYEVNREGAQEVIRQSLYDYQAYDATNGHSQLNFFQIPVGQGSTPKTLEDTNMEIGGSLPSPKRFLLETIEVYFWPGDNPSSYGAGAVSNFVNDIYNVLKSAYLRLFIGSKDYLVEGPLMRFPPKTGLEVSAAAADSTTAGADQQTQIAYATAKGRPYRVQPQLVIPPTQNFKVSIDWPNGAVALNSATNARIGVVMDGLIYRLSQ